MKELKRLVFLTLGIIFFILGFIGIVLPIIPGIPFFLIGIIFIARGSKKFLKWILKNKIMGKYIRMIRKEGISKKAKSISLATIWTTHILSIVFIKINIVRVFLGLVLLLVTWILISLKSKENPKKVKLSVINEKA